MKTTKPTRGYVHALTVLALLFIIPKVRAQQEQPYEGKIGKTLAESQEYYTPYPTAPKGAPNVIWILLDDVGFGASSTFGGLIPTPTFDSLANPKGQTAARVVLPPPFPDNNPRSR